MQPMRLVSAGVVDKHLLSNVLFVLDVAEETLVNFAFILARYGAAIDDNTRSKW